MPVDMDGAHAGKEFGSEAVLFGVQALCKVSDQHILILSDNTSTVGAINTMGSSKSASLDSTILDIWSRALERNNWLSCSQIPGILNEEADEESRKQGLRTEWMLNIDTFFCITQQLDFCPDIDFFASRLNGQLSRFVSFRPDPEAERVNSFTFSWKTLDSCPFPPLYVFPRLSKRLSWIQQLGYW